jgi:hypothetical protein
VEGFVFERCGNQYPTNFWQPAHAAWQQAGAVGTRSGRHWTIRGNIIRFATGIGLDCGNEGAADVDVETGDNGRAVNAGHHLIEANHIIDNGGAGTASYNGTHLTIRGNVVERNNRLRFTGKKRWESAGIKLHNPAHSVIEHNLVRDNYGKWGIWLDQGAGQDTRVVGNVVISQGVGIDFEIGSARPALVTDNILIANDIGIGSRESGGLTIAHNLLLGSRKAGISFSIDHSRGGGWSAAHNHVYSNLFIGGSGPFQEVAAPDDFRSEDRRLDFNVYAMEPAERRLAIGKKPPQMLTEWQTTWQGYNGETNADLHSVAQPGSSYRFDPATLRLELEIAFNPAAIGALPIAGRTADFLGQPLAAERPAPVGPFRELIRGKNILAFGTGHRRWPILPTERPGPADQSLHIQSTLWASVFPSRGFCRRVVRALVFDFDGLILDTETPLIEAYADVHAAHGRPFDRAEFLRCVGHIDFAFNPWSAFGPHANEAALEAERHVHNRRRTLAQPLLPGVAELLQAARAAGLKLGVASNSSHQHVEGHLARLGIHAHFSFFACRGDTPSRNLSRTSIGSC